MESSSERPTDMSRERLIQELEDTREQLKRQKNLKEMYINRGKETTKELEQLRKYSDDATLSKAKIAAQVRDNTKQKKKKDLHKDYEELKVAYLTNEEMHGAALQEEKHKNKLLQEELDQISVSHSELTLRYEADVTEVRQQFDTLHDKVTAELQGRQQKYNLLQDKLVRISQEYISEVITVRQRAQSLQRELERQVEAHADSVTKSLRVITYLKAERDDVHQRMTEEINSLQQNALQKEERYERQLEELKAQFAVQTLSTELKASKEADVPEETACEQKSIDTASAPELLEVTQVSEDTQPKSLPEKEPVTCWD